MTMNIRAIANQKGGSMEEIMELQHQPEPGRVIAGSTKIEPAKQFCAAASKQH